MSESQELATAQSQVPALANTPALEISAEDVALPRLYIGQFMSEHVQNNLVEAGQLFTALGQDDPEPVVLGQGVVVHILAMRKGKSVSAGGELELYAFDDPDAPADAWTTYNYVVAIPEADDEIPYKWLLTRTGTPAAKQINMALRRGAIRGPAHELAFEVTTAKRENDKGKFFVPRVRVIDPKPENIAIAESFLGFAGSAEEPASTPSEPAI